ncbi:P-loop ATPase, Sll1717 family [Alicycliphilus denitrificans]|uniref:P-loop ATPase, Sll1717 family n=1 Tax=Alicycliphilus denitrificans TaxID=179636 RepID=UPI00384CD86C
MEATIGGVDKAFVAYPSRDSSLAGIIAEGVAKANRMSGKRLRYTPWEFNDVAGNPLISPILEGIESSKFVVADITYLNPNVVYEIGFAIGRSRRCFLIRHSHTEGDKRVAREVGIFDTLGYDIYDDSDGLAGSLTAYVDPKPLAFSTALDRLAPVYVVEPPTKGGVTTVMTSRLKKARYKYRSFNPAEDARLSAADAIRQVASSAGILLYFLDGSQETNFIHDTRTLFVAGLAHGMGKPTLILAHGSADIPLDVRDVVKRFGRSEDIIDHIAAFSLEITEHLQQADPTPLKDLTPLQSLQIGDPTAENEMTTLGSYFLRTDQYSKAVRGEVNLVVGRKGAGKTALFIQVRDKTRSDKRNVVLDLKPEGYQLLKLKEDILAHLTQGASHHLVTAFWEYLILLEITYKLLEKDHSAHKFNHEIRDLYLELEQTYKTEGYSVEGDFSERLLALSQRIAQDYAQRFGDTDGTKLSTDQVTQLVYSHDVRHLRRQVSAYLEHKQSVWVLFDNLDKGWSTQGVDAVDAMVLRCLIDAGRKVERDMRKDGHIVHCIAFIRNDVYEHLMRQSADYGKEMRVALDWTDPDMLRELLRLRLMSGLPASSVNVGFDQIWPQLCISHYKGEETSAYIIERSLMRPRNVIKMFAHAKGFAANLAHQKIQESDLEKGIRAYSQDLLVELDHELTDVFPDSRDLLYHFIDAPPQLTEAVLTELIASAGIESSDVQRVIDFLLYYGILGIQDSAEHIHYIFNVNYDLKVLQVRAARAKSDAVYVMNPAFRPALGIRDTNSV